jgi:hypothetical protein
VFPAEDAGFVAGGFGFGDHAFALVGARNRRPGQDVFGIEFEQALARFDGAVKILLGVVGLREAMERVGKLGIKSERFFVLRDGFRVFSFAKIISAGIVVVFGGRIRRAAHASILTLDNRKFLRAYAAPRQNSRVQVTAC